MPSLVLALGGDRSKTVPLITVKEREEPLGKTVDREERRRPDTGAVILLLNISYRAPKGRSRMTWHAHSVPGPFEEFGRTPRVLYAHERRETSVEREVGTMVVRDPDEKIIFSGEPRELRKYDEQKSVSAVRRN